MRSTFKVIIVSLLAISACCLFAFRDVSPEQAIQRRLIMQADSLVAAVQLLQQVPANPAYIRALQAQFRQTRLAYKRLEWAAEYFDPLTTRQVNGPPVPETELSGQVIQPDGFQVIEQLLFPRFVPSSKKQLADLLERLAANAAEYQAYLGHAQLQGWQIIDAVKLEVFRVETLGLNRFDDPLAGNCFTESAEALNSTQTVMRYYTPASDKQLNTCFQRAINYLLRPVTFNSFNRAAFLTQYANPLTTAITNLRKQLAMPDIRYNRLLNQDAATLFDRAAFNRNAYIDNPGDSATIQKIVLGKKLFFDPLLSGTMTRSCASCHEPEKAFTDGLPKNTDLTGKKKIARNTPTLINAALQAAQFYDMRAASLEDQIVDVVRNRDEMHGNMQLSTQKFWRDTAYRRLFATAFPAENRHLIDTLEVMNALAGYIRSLTALSSRFDIYMQGKRTALTPAEVNGFNLFMGKARCATCHYLPLFNGTLPPRYMQLDAEVIGVPQTRTGKRIDPDPGLYTFVPEAFNRHAFKTTTVRNANQTAPYMHNGVFRTLKEVIDFYDKGGGAGLGIKIDNQTLATDQLHLTVKEKKELVAFIKSLDNR
jgi:cytochrome c peroxidase